MTEHGIAFIKLVITVSVVFIPLFIVFLWKIGAIGGSDNSHSYRYTRSNTNVDSADTSTYNFNALETIVVASVVMDSFEGGNNND